MWLGRGPRMAQKKHMCNRSRMYTHARLSCGYLWCLHHTNPQLLCTVLVRNSCLTLRLPSRALEMLSLLLHVSRRCSKKLNVKHDYQ